MEATGSPAEMERLEAQIDASRRLALEVLALHNTFLGHVRRALVEANAPGWFVENGAIFKIGDAVPD